MVTKKLDGFLGQAKQNYWQYLPECPPPLSPCLVTQSTSQGSLRSWRLPFVVRKARVVSEPSPLAPSPIVSLSSSVQLLPGCISYFTNYKRKKAPKKLPATQATPFCMARQKPLRECLHPSPPPPVPSLLLDILSSEKSWQAGEYLNITEAAELFKLENMNYRQLD